MQASSARLEEPHIAPLTEFVKRIRLETDAKVPWFDPADAGVEARALFLFQDPGRSGAAVSGYVSVDNDDPSARAITQLRASAGLRRGEVVHWNAIPWELDRDPKVSDIVDAQPYTDELIDLLPCLQVVVAFGRWAQQAWIGRRYGGRFDIVGFGCPHTSQRALNQPGNRERVAATLAETRRVLDHHGPRKSAATL